MTITIDHHSDVALLRIAFGDSNAMGSEFIAALTQALDQVETAKALVLTGHGRCFSVGLDLPALLGLEEEPLRSFIEQFSRVMERLFLWEKPTVAALNGHAVAGGFVLGACCDFRVLGAERAKLGMTGVPLGIAYPSLVSAMLGYVLPPQTLHPVLLQGRLFSADDALSAGLVHERVAPDKLLGHALGLAQTLALHDADAYASTKRSLKRKVAFGARENASASHYAFTRAVLSESVRARIAQASARNAPAKSS